MNSRDWAQHGVVTVGGIKRAVKFLNAETGSIYSSMYGPISGEVSSTRLVVVPAWHADGDYGFEIAHYVCAGVAKRGGVAGMFHWPGHGESEGDPRNVTMAQLVAAGRAVLDELNACYGPGQLAVAGVKVGAVAAVELARSGDAGKLMLIEPDLNAQSHFDSIERMARRTSLGKQLPAQWAASRFVPTRLKEAEVPVPSPSDGSFDHPMRVGVVRYESSASVEAPSVEQLVVPGTLRRRSPDHHQGLRQAAIEWLSVGV